MVNEKAGGLKQGLTNVGDAGFALVLRKISIKGTGYCEDVHRFEMTRLVHEGSESGYLKLVPGSVFQVDEGCDFDFLVPVAGGAVPQAHEDIS